MCTICLIAAALMSRDSDYAKQIFNLCAEICKACVQECEKHTNMDLVKNVLKYVETVPKNVEKCQGKILKPR